MSKTLVLQPIEAILSFKISRITDIDPYCILVSNTSQTVSDVCYNSGKYPCWDETLTVQVKHEPKCFLVIKDKVMIFSDRYIGYVELDLKEIQVQEIVSKWFPIIQNKKTVGEIFLKTWIVSEEKFTEKPETNEEFGIDTVEYQQEELVKKSSNLSDSLDQARTTVGTMDSLVHSSAEKDLSNKDMTKSGSLTHKEEDEHEEREDRKSDNQVVQSISELFHPDEAESPQKNEFQDKNSKFRVFSLTQVDQSSEDERSITPMEQEEIEELSEKEGFAACNDQAVPELPGQINQSDVMIENQIDSPKGTSMTESIKQEVLNEVSQSEESSSLLASNVMEKKEEYESEFPVNILEDDYNDNNAVKKKEGNNAFLKHMDAGRESNEKAIDQSEQDRADDDQVVSSYASSSEDNTIDEKALRSLRLLFDEREAKMDVKDTEEEKHSCSEEACDKIKSFDQQRHLNDYTTNFSQIESKEEEKIEAKETKEPEEKVVVLTLETNAQANFRQELDTLNKKNNVSKEENVAKEEVSISEMWGIYDLDIFNYTLRDIPGYDYEVPLSFKVNGGEMVFKDVYNYKVF